MALRWRGDVSKALSNDMTCLSRQPSCNSGRARALTGPEHTVSPVFGRDCQGAASASSPFVILQCCLAGPWVAGARCQTEVAFLEARCSLSHPKDLSKINELSPHLTFVKGKRG